MISDVVVTAVATLQKRAMGTSDLYKLDRIERALDELLRNPGSSRVPATYRIRSAMGHAYETLERRKTIVPQAELTQEFHEPSYIESAFFKVEILAWICVEPEFREPDRELLMDLALGHEAEALAEQHGVSLPRMRERISRCRRRARELRANLDLVA